MLAPRSLGPTLRTLLILGRISNLPTVWSNCLAGWILAGGGDWPGLVVACLGGAFLYIGGMYLNDAFDTAYDQQHRRGRPIPSGAISTTAVWQWGFGWLLLGAISLSWLGKTQAVLTLFLTASILLYDAVHKIVAVSPILLGLCRCLLLLMGASAALHGITGYALWAALALGFYTTGVSFLARRESTHAPPLRWPCLLLAVPLVLALLVNSGAYLGRGIVFCGVLLLWSLLSLRFAYWTDQRNVGRSVAGLLAGMVLVDLLAVGPDPGNPIFAFLLLFGLALLLQRFIPAT